MQNFIQNLYPLLKPPEHEKIIKPKPHKKTNPEKSSNLQPRKMSNPETSNLEHELHFSCFSPNQD